jgi:hypothetical protein
LGKFLCLRTHSYRIGRSNVWPRSTGNRVLGIPVGALISAYGFWGADNKTPSFVMPVFLKIIMFAGVSFIVFPGLNFVAAVAIMALWGAVIAIFASCELGVPLPDHDHTVMPWWQTALMVIVLLYGTHIGFRLIEQGDLWYIILGAFGAFICAFWFLLLHPYDGRALWRTSAKA